MRPTKTHLFRSVFWAVVVATHLALLRWLLQSSLTQAELASRREWAQRTSAHGRAAFFVLIAASIALLAWSSIRARSDLDTVVARVLATAMVVGSTLLVVTAAGTLVLLLPLKAAFGGDPGGCGMAALSIGACVAWVACLATGALGANLDHRLPTQAIDWRATWTGQRWAVGGSLASSAIALAFPYTSGGLTSLIGPVVVVVALSVAGYLYSGPRLGRPQPN